MPVHGIHDTGLEIYNADAAHCLPAVVTEMLIDSRPGIVELLPALPAEWRRGSLRGIATRARVTVGELSWDLDDGVVRAVLTSAQEQPVTLVCRRAREAADQRLSIRLPAGAPVTVTVRM